jgi:hypothetical protein
MEEIVDDILGEQSPKQTVRSIRQEVLMFCGK